MNKTGAENEVRILAPPKRLELIVKNILVFENGEKNRQTILPFFADGFPGMMFHDSPGGLRVNPQNKRMPPVFIYGQTIHPIELEIAGEYQIIVFQLFPFVLKGLFDLDPSSLNDDCFDLAKSGDADAANLAERTLSIPSLEGRIGQIAEVLERLFESKKNRLREIMRESFDLIFKAKGKVVISELAATLHLNRRTFERLFRKETGLPPKQFAQIIQFQNAFAQLAQKDYRLLTDIVYQNGYADQSHFIRVFKAYTRQTPGKFGRAG